MHVSVLKPLLTMAGLLSLGVFVVAFKFVAQEACRSRAPRFEPSLPRAVLRTAGHAAGARWLRGLARERLVSCVRVLQTGIVAFGVTAMFVMFLCMAGVVAAMLLDQL